MNKSSTLRMQQWGNSLAIRVPAALAREARLTLGQPVQLALKEGVLMVQAVGEPELTLAQRLARFDPSVHGGEMMNDVSRGVEFGAAERIDAPVDQASSTGTTRSSTAGRVSDSAAAEHDAEIGSDLRDEVNLERRRSPRSRLR